MTKYRRTSLFFLFSKKWRPGWQVPGNFRGQNTTARQKISQQKYNQNYEDLDQCLQDVGDNQEILTTTF